MDVEINLKKGQVTIFVILGVFIVFAIITGFFLFDKKIETSEEIRINPQSTVRECVKESLKESIVKVLSRGGLKDFVNFATYDGEKYNYLCYHSEDYLPCYNRYPGLKLVVEENIKQDTLSEVQNCFDSMREDFEDRGFEVSGSPATYSVSILPGGVRIALEKDIVLSKGDFSMSVKNFDTGTHTSLYNLIEVARKIINDESQYCTFDNVGYTLLYPRYNIEKMALSSGRAYIVENRETFEKFKFAVRSCSSPSGL